MRRGAGLGASAAPDGRAQGPAAPETLCADAAKHREPCGSGADRLRRHLLYAHRTPETGDGADRADQTRRTARGALFRRRCEHRPRAAGFAGAPDRNGRRRGAHRREQSRLQVPARTEKGASRRVQHAGHAPRQRIQPHAGRRHAGMAERRLAPAVLHLGPGPRTPRMARRRSLFRGGSRRPAAFHRRIGRPKHPGAGNALQHQHL